MIKRQSEEEAGDWQNLDLPREHERYAAIAEVLRGCQPGQRVLDVGCGTAQLRTWLPPGVAYTGIEPSAGAVQVARKRNSSDNLIHISAEHYDAGGELFDAIVFNEMLYYLADPVGVLQKLLASLNRTVSSSVRFTRRQVVLRWGDGLGTGLAGGVLIPTCIVRRWCGLSWPMKGG